MKKKLVLDELEKIRKRNRKQLLQPKAVVDAARAPGSPLHSFFEWEDSKAAEKYRIVQARELIVRVTIVREEVKSAYQFYVSLPSNRTGRGGGYSKLDDVLTSSDLRREMLQSALTDLEIFQARYQRLTELAAVFAAVAKLKKGVKKKKAA